MATSDAVQGETGTGKELSNLIHQHSLRSARPIVSINVAHSRPLLESEPFGHVRGAFTGADTTTAVCLCRPIKVHCSMKSASSLKRKLPAARLARAHCYPCRWQPVATSRCAHHRATHRDLSAEVAAGRFRQDLFYRLNVVNLMIPLLRDRREDIPVLVNHFLQRFNREHFKQVAVFPPQ